MSVYGCGHIHNFQYIKKSGDNINYWVNSAAALARPVEPMESTRWCSSSTGFTKVSASKQQLILYAVNKEGKILYSLPMKKSRISTFFHCRHSLFPLLTIIVHADDGREYLPFPKFVESHFHQVPQLL